MKTILLMLMITICLNAKGQELKDSLIKEAVVELFLEYEKSLIDTVQNELWALTMDYNTNYYQISEKPLVILREPSFMDFLNWIKKDKAEKKRRKYFVPWGRRCSNN